MTRRAANLLSVLLYSVRSDEVEIITSIDAVGPFADDDCGQLAVAYPGTDRLWMDL